MSSDHSVGSPLAPNGCLAIVPVDTAHPSGSTTSAALTSNPSPECNTGFAGLVNSGMTCYMNSLLQTLFMTPEFRNALYSWRFEGTPAEAVNSIPHQLQRLFVQLQTTKSASVSTTGVSTSFGWRSSDVSQQHDIHELCRVMFDALEKKFGHLPQSSLHNSQHTEPGQTSITGDTAHLKHAPTQDLINRLYQGLRSDCVRCTVCNRVSCRPDTFLDIQVPLRPFELNATPYGSLEDAFRGMIKPERLDGSNQYYCSRCQVKRDAERVCAFHRMPYLLTLQLMRFTFDLTTLRRIKLNDRFTFPLDRWDVSEFITPQPADTHSDDENTDGESLNCATEDGIEDYPETENEYELITETSRQVHALSTASVLRHNDRLARSVSSVDDLEEMDAGAGDSGVNSTTADSSPYDIEFSSTSNVGSPNVEEELRAIESDAEYLENSTITASFPPGLAFEKTVATAVLKFPELDGKIVDIVHPDHMVDTDEDDGFVTGGTRSACSSTTNCSSVIGHPDLSEPSTTHNRFLPARPHKLKALHRRVASSELTPTKDRAHKKPIPTLYELFSIMVHSGSTNGGHYYAYIRSFDDGQWYCFNDTHVSRASQADLEETFGSTSSPYLSRANAYFLMYRRIDPQMNESFLPPDRFPDHIKDLISVIENEQAEAERQRELERSVCKFEAYTRSPATHEIIEVVVNLFKNQTMNEAAETVRQALLPGCKGEFRVVQYSSSASSLGKSSEHALWHRPPVISADFNPIPVDSAAAESAAVGNTATALTNEPKPVRTDAENLVTVEEFAEYKRLYPFKLWLEHRVNVPGAVAESNVSNSSWKPYDCRGITLHVHRVDITRELVFPEEKLWFAETATVDEVAEEIWQLYTSCCITALDASCVPFSDMLLLADGCCRGKQHTPPVDVFLPEWALVLSDSISLGTPLVDVFPESVADLTNTYSFRRCEPAHVFVDLGPKYDGVTVVNDHAGPNTQAATWKVDSEAKRGRWQLPTGKTGSSQFATNRLHQLAAIVDEDMFYVQAKVYLPDKQKINSIVLQRNLLDSLDSESMDWDESSYTRVDEEDLRASETPAVEVPEVECNGEGWSDWLKRATTNLVSHFVHDNQCGADSHPSSSDSGCSVTANRGSPKSGRRSSSPLDFSPVSSPGPLSRRRRSSSQSNLPELKNDDLSKRNWFAPSTTNVTTNRPTLLTDDLAGMHVGRTNEQLIDATHVPAYGDVAYSGCAQPSRHCLFQSHVSGDTDTPVSQMHPGNIISVTLDKRLKVEQFIAVLADYLHLNRETVQIHVHVQQRIVSDDFVQLKPTDMIEVTMDHHLKPDLMRLDLRVLDLSGCGRDMIPGDSSNPCCPVWQVPLSILCRMSWSVMRILVYVSGLLKSLYGFEVPVRRLRLRKCGLSEPTPGPLLSLPDCLSSFHNPHQNLMVQILPPVDDKSADLADVTDKSSTPFIDTATGFVFARQWHPSSSSFGTDWYEIPIRGSADRCLRWSMIIERIQSICDIPVNRLSVSWCNFPGVSSVSKMEASAGWQMPAISWHLVSSYDPSIQPVPTNSQVVYFKDSGETYSHTTPHSVEQQRPLSSSSSFSGLRSLTSAFEPPSIGPKNDLFNGTPQIGPLFSNCDDVSSKLSHSPARTNHLDSGRLFEQPLRIFTAEDSTEITHSGSRAVGSRDSRTP